MRRSAAIVTVGSELTEGLRLDTNTQEIAFSLSSAGFHVLETLSVGDEREVLAEQLARMTARYELVVVTGGLGPTHDDITRDAAAAALGVGQSPDARIEAKLSKVRARHSDSEAAERILIQALVLDGASVMDATTGTAPGQIIPTSAGHLVLLPGPPTEMRPMLAETVRRFGGTRAAIRELGIAQMTESDVQLAVERAIAGIEGVGFTVLARPGDVRAIFTDEGGGDSALEAAACNSAIALGDRCYATDGASLAEVIVREATARGLTIALAESCTGGMIAAAITDVAGSSECFAGGVVSYSNQAKIDLLGVAPRTLEERGAVSPETVEAMALGASEAFGADVVLSVSGIAGPGGGTAEKPVGLVWFGVLSRREFPTLRAFPKTTPSMQFPREFFGDRAGVRLRATSYGLDQLRRAVLGLPVGP